MTKNGPLEDNLVVESLIGEKIELSDETINAKILKKLKEARNISDLSQLKLPEEIALSFDTLYEDMVAFIDEKGSDQLKEEWRLYRQALKVKFGKTSKETLMEMQANYQLGIESKSFPNINFYFGNDIKEYQALNVILEQTKLQREKNAVEAEAMGVNNVMEKGDRLTNEFVDNLDFD